MGKFICAVFLFGVALAAPGLADTVVANSPGSLPGTAENLSTDKYLTDIEGTLDFPDGVDVFKIDIVAPMDFAAYTVPTGAYGVPDPELFLFNSSGLGVYENDDMSGSDTQSCLPSADSHNPCPSSRGGSGPLTAGIYYLAITRSDNSPLSSKGYIFSPALSTDVAGPDLSKGGAHPVIGWDNNVFTGPDFDLVNYDIHISDTPEPAMWPLTAGLLAALVLFRRKLRTR